MGGWMNLDLRKDGLWNKDLRWRRPLAEANKDAIAVVPPERWEPGPRSRLWGMDRGGRLESE